MNENDANITLSINNVCRVCLNTTNYLSPLSDEHIKLYITLVDEIVYKEFAMKVCVICQWMFRKFTKFKRQCRTANYLLKQATYKDSKSLLLPQQMTSIHHMTQTSPSIHNYTPTLNNTLRNDTHYSVHTNNTLNNDISCNNTSNCAVFTHTFKKDIDVNRIDQDFVDTFDNDDYVKNDKYVNENDEYTNENDNYRNENDECTNEHDEYKNESNKYTNKNYKYTNENDKYTNENDTHDYNEDEDEIPLVMISKDKSKGRTKKKSKKKKKVVDERVSPKKPAVIQESAVKQKREENSKDDVKSKRSNKVLRDGFSSRMVQETNEYVVIKLTKEQVLQEMCERSKTDAYISSPFKCDKCVKGFNFQDVLNTHMEKHSAKNCNFSCDICGQCCPSAVSLRGHVKSHTTRYKCKVCGAVRVARQHLMEHHAEHSGAAPAYECLHCRFTTNKRTVMQRHARAHAQREPHACDKCGKLFKTIHYLRLHTARHDKSSRFKCELCPDTFVYHSLLRKHVQCVHERKEFYCVECDVQFKCAESLRVHFKRAKKHRDPTALKHACNKCSARFFTAGSLATHLSCTHDAFKQHACQHCHRTYSTRDAVRAHTWRVHARGDARASCPHCHTNFVRKSVLKAHLSAHRGACAVINKSQKEELPEYETKIEV